MTREPRAALGGWIASTGYTHREIGALFGVTKDAVRQWVTGNVRVPARVQRRLVAEGWLPRRDHRGPDRAPLNHQPLCPPDHACRSCRLRRRYATQGALGVRRDLWTPEADTRLRVLAGSASLAVIAQQITDEFGVERSAHAIMVRCHRLGLSIVRTAYTAAQVAYYCGVGEATVARWIGLEWLPSERARAHAAHTITAEALETFLRAHPGIVDWRTMPVQHSPERRWRELVEGLWRRQPFYDVQTVAGWLGVHRATVHRWCQAGELQGWRVPSARGKGGLPRWRIPQSAVLAFERQRESA